MPSNLRGERRKHYVPLESNPEVFTQLIHKLGVKGLAFEDVYSITEPDLIAMISRPALALVLIFPTSDTYEEFREQDDAGKEVYVGKGDDEPIVWYKQTIGNACGLYAILHAISNGPAREYIDPSSTMATLLAEGVPLGPEERARLLEDSKELERSHAYAAQQGDTAAPDSAEVNVDYHYVCFAPSHKPTADSGHELYELDGTRPGPLPREIIIPSGGDVLSPEALKPVQEFIEREQGKNSGFGLMALVVPQGA